MIEPYDQDADFGEALPSDDARYLATAMRWEQACRIGCSQLYWQMMEDEARLSCEQIHRLTAKYGEQFGVGPLKPCPEHSEPYSGAIEVAWSLDEVRQMEALMQSADSPASLLSILDNS
jgi:hypothetical protein